MRRNYILPDGTKVPGVTTILQVINKPALLTWANKLGLEGKELGKHVDHLAAIGTCAHEIIACHWLGKAPDLKDFSREVIDKAENAALSYFNWESQHTVKPLLVEEPFVSLLGYGGTVDCVGMIDGKVTLLDLKTGQSIWPEYGHQLAAYVQLLAENKYPVEEARILKVGRTEDEGFEDRVYSLNQLRPHLEIFFAALKIYRLQKVKES